MSQKPTEFSLLPKIINGSIAGVIGVGSVYPLDLCKTRLQNQQPGPNGELVYNSIQQCIRKTYHGEGFLGMYRGLMINCVLIAPEKAIKLGANDYFRNHLMSNDGSLPLLYQMLAGGLAGLFQVIITTPMELLEIQMQSAGRVVLEQKKKKKKRHIKFPTTLTVVTKILRKEGIAGMYRGLTCTALRDVSFSMVYFPVFATLNNMGPRKTDGSGEAVPWCSFLAGMSSGTLAALVVTPIDVVKTRLQTLMRASGEKKFKGIIDCFLRTWKHEGFFAFFKGGLCRIMVIAPLFGIAQVVYFMGVAEKMLGIKYHKTV